MRFLLFTASAIVLAGCHSVPQTAHSRISAGAWQDSDTEIPGKPQPMGSSQGQPQVGYNQPAGQMDPNTQVHYHYHYHMNQAAGSSTQIPGPPTASTQGAQTGYAQPQYHTHIHHSSLNPYANPYSVQTSPYANNPNDGNSAKSVSPYYRPSYGAGSNGWGSGRFNPYMNDGAGGFADQE